jgi:tight adherence protein C
MLIILLTAFFLAGSAVALAARALLIRRMRAGDALGGIDSYGFNARVREETNSGTLRAALDELAATAGGMLALAPGGDRELGLRRMLMSAGLYRVSPRKLQGYRLLCAVSVPAVWLGAGAVGGFATALVAVGIPCAAVVGWIAPTVILRSRARRRFTEIDWELPELIDVLVVTVEAGLGFNGSLRVASERLGGALGDELRLTLQEQNMGLSTTEALKNLLGRCDSPAMRSFVRAIIQGEQLGVSIGQIMRDLALEMRKRRRQAAEEKAHKAPIKILFPLVFLIFPAMFVILLAPAVYSFLDAF